MVGNEGDVAGEDGVTVDEEGAVVADAGGDAGAVSDLDGAAEHAGPATPGVEEGGGVHVDGVDGGDEAREEAGAVGGGAAQGGEGGGLREVVEGGLPDVDPDAEDDGGVGVGAATGGGARLELGQDAAELEDAVVAEDDEVVGPLEGDVEDGGHGGGPGEHGARDTCGGEVWTQEHAEEEVLAGLGIPGAASAAPAGGLVVGDHDGKWSAEGHGAGEVAGDAVGGGAGGEVGDRSRQAPVQGGRAPAHVMVEGEAVVGEADGVAFLAQLAEVVVQGGGAAAQAGGEGGGSDAGRVLGEHGEDGCTAHGGPPVAARGIAWDDRGLVSPFWGVAGPDAADRQGGMSDLPAPEEASIIAPVSAVPSSTPDAPEAPPHALAPAAVGLWRLQRFIRLGVVVLPFSIAAGIGLSTVTHWGVGAIVGGALLLVNLVLAIVWPPLQYDAFRYAVRHHDLLVQSGVFFRRWSSVPLSRIQHVDSRQGPLERLFGVQRVLVYTAAGVSADGVIPALTEDNATALRDALSRRGGDDGV